MKHCQYNLPQAVNKLSDCIRCLCNCLSLASFYALRLALLLILIILTRFFFCLCFCEACPWDRLAGKLQSRTASEQQPDCSALISLPLWNNIQAQSCFCTEIFPIPPPCLIQPCPIDDIQRFPAWLDAHVACFPFLYWKSCQDSSALESALDLK